MQVAVLSPHRDDAAFSCGLTLQRLLRAGCTLTIVSVRTVSQYAPYLAEPPGDRTQQITELRRNEDADFVTKLCRLSAAEDSQVKFVDLAWQDVPLRWSIEDHLALAPTRLRPNEVQDLSYAFRALAPFDIVFVPMALGGHLDHRLVLQAAQQAFPALTMAFYEDLPYACRISVSEKSEDRGFALETILPLSEIWLPVQAAVKGSKREYALCYPSQIAVDVAEEMENYSVKHGGRERFLMGKAAMGLLQTWSQREGAVIA